MSSCPCPRISTARKAEIVHLGAFLSDAYNPRNYKGQYLPPLPTRKIKQTLCTEDWKPTFLLLLCCKCFFELKYMLVMLFVFFCHHSVSTQCVTSLKDFLAWYQCLLKKKCNFHTTKETWDKRLSEMPANPVQDGHPKGSYSETHWVNQLGVGLAEMAGSGANCCSADHITTKRMCKGTSGSVQLSSMFRRDCSDTCHQPAATHVAQSSSGCSPPSHAPGPSYKPRHRAVEPLICEKLLPPEKS